MVFQRKAPAAKWSRALDEVPLAVWRGAWLLGLGYQQRVAKLDERVAADKRAGLADMVDALKTIELETMTVTMSS